MLGRGPRGQGRGARPTQWASRFSPRATRTPREGALMSYSLATLWYERERFLPGVLAVAFSALLIALQCGLLLGLYSITSLPIDQSRADVWVGHPKVLSVDLGKGIPADWLAYVATLPEVLQSEI